MRDPAALQCIAIEQLCQRPAAAAPPQAAYPPEVIAGIVLALVAVLLITTGAYKLRPTSLTVDIKAARDALDHIADWSKWMAGIQTAAFAGLGLLVFDQDFTKAQLPDPLLGIAAAAFVLLAAALLCTSWALAALPSLLLRLEVIHAETPAPSTEFDIYDQTLFGWMTGTPLAFGTLGVVLTVKHWCWFIGLVLLSIILLALL